MQISTTALITIFGMALVTYATRISGLLLMNRVTPSRRVQAWLEHIPGAVLVSIVAPTALASGIPETLAAAATMLVAARSKNLLLAMIAGVVAVWLFRLLIPHM